MGIRKYKPTTPGRRGSSVADFVELTRSTPEKSLLAPKPKTGGRNNSGRITTRHIGGGHKQADRIIDFETGGCGCGSNPAEVIRVDLDGVDDYAALMATARQSGADAVFDDARAIRDGGGNGSIIGRNSFQRSREDALEMLGKLVDIYLGKA